MAPQTRGVSSRYVSRGENCRIAGTAKFVRYYAICDRKAGTLCQLRVRKPTNADDHRVSKDFLTVLRKNDASLVSPLNRLNDCFAAELDTVPAMKHGQDPSDVGGDDARHRVALLPQYDDVTSGLACGRGYFQADQTGTNDNYSSIGSKLPAEIEAVVEIP